MTNGKVFLVGSGPGDPGLLTVKALRVLAAADVVVYDNLVSDAILDRLPATVERIHAGKETGLHIMNQAAINALLEERALNGQTVVRLKGGDPFVFGRGGEEAEYLSARSIPFEVVPGVSSAIAVPAYAGIPVTHRGVAASLAIVTGRAGPIGEAPDVKWEHVAGADTIVVLMGVANQDQLVRTLIEHGRSPDTPVAAIRWGTTAQQRTVVGTLGTLVSKLDEAKLRPPAILVVGSVVSLVPRMRWAEARPLFGRRVLLPAAPPTPLTEVLETFGAEVLHVDPVETHPPGSWRALDDALDRLGTFTGVVFADEVGVGAVFERLGARGRDARALADRRLIACGARAAAALRRRGIAADRVLEPDDEAAEVGGDSSDRWLVVGTPDAQVKIASALHRDGRRAETPPVCSTTIPKWRGDRLRELLTTRPAHAIAFMDLGEVRKLLAALDMEERELLRRLTLVASGARAARALTDAGLEPAVIVTDRSPAALAHALAMVAMPVDRDRG